MRKSLPLTFPALVALAAGYGLRVYAEGAPTAKPLFYAGSLEANGKPATGPHTIALSLFEVESGGSAMCTSETPNAPVDAGRFRVEVSAECVAALRQKPDVWVALRFTGPDGVPHELPFRSKIGAVPYAMEAQHAVTASAASAGLASQLVPPGAVMFFNLAACPTGWAPLPAAQGRYVVGAAPDGEVAATVGTQLGNKENRAVGQHDHPVTDPGHDHGGVSGAVANFSGTDGARDYSGVGAGCSRGFGYVNTSGCVNYFSQHQHPIPSGTTKVSVGSAGSVAGTNAPYIQLLACQKS